MWDLVGGACRYTCDSGSGGGKVSTAASAAIVDARHRRRRGELVMHKRRCRVLVRRLR